MTHILQPDNSVDVDVPKTILLQLVIPEGTTSTYDITVQTPVGSGLPMFQLCSISILSVGNNMPCVISGDKTPSYTSTVGATHSDKGTISLGSITNLALTPGSTAENTIALEVIVTPLEHAAVTISSTHDVTVTIRYGVGIDISHAVTLQVGGITPAPELGVSRKTCLNQLAFFLN